MHIDVAASERLTRGIDRGHKVAARLRVRRRVDERFDPAKALAGTVRYLRIAKQRLGRTDLAIAAYHMGIGNMQTALPAYGKRDIPYARLFFDSTPLRHAKAYRILAALGDDSSTYLWRVNAAREIMRLYREDPETLARQAELQGRKASAEEVLHPADKTPPYGDPFAVGRARASGQLVALSPQQLAGFGIRVDPRMGELAGRLHQSRRLYRALRPQALRMLEVIGARHARDRPHAPARRHEHRARRALPARARRAQHRGDAQLLAAHDRLGVRHLALVPLARAGARVPVHARPPDGAEHDRLGARARRDPCDGRVAVGGPTAAAAPPAGRGR